MTTTDPDDDEHRFMAAVNDHNAAYRADLINGFWSGLVIGATFLCAVVFAAVMWGTP